MRIKKVPYATLEPLIRRHLSTTEDESTSALIRRLEPARDRGHLTRAELLAVCNWKSPRAIRHVRANNSEQVRRATKRALDTRSERVASRPCSASKASRFRWRRRSSRFSTRDGT